MHLICLSHLQPKSVNRQTWCLHSAIWRHKEINCPVLSGIVLSRTLSSKVMPCRHVCQYMSQWISRLRVPCCVSESLRTAEKTSAEPNILCLKEFCSDQHLNWKVNKWQKMAANNFWMTHLGENNPIPLTLILIQFDSCLFRDWANNQMVNDRHSVIHKHK